jgi:hypothetical protein
MSGWPACIFSLGLLVAGLCSQVAAQSPANPGESLETLTTDANDPTAILAQLKIEEDYTPDEYGTQAEPNTIQIQPVIPIRPFSFIALAAIAQAYLQSDHDSLRLRTVD